MPDRSDDKLGGRLDLLAPERLAGESRALYDRLMEGPVAAGERTGYETRTDDGRLIGPFNALLRTPQASMGLLAFSQGEAEGSTLSDRLRQVVLLAVGSVWRAEFELYAHALAAQAAGLSRDCADQLAVGKVCDELSEPEAIAYHFALALTGGRRVDDALYERARDALGDQGLADVVMLTARYHVTCVVLNAYEVPAPAGSGDVD